MSNTCGKPHQRYQWVVALYRSLSLNFLAMTIHLRL